MARGGAAASSACTREVRFAATGRDTGDGPSGSAELSRRARLQPEVLAGAGGGSRRRRSSGRRMCVGRKGCYRMPCLVFSRSRLSNHTREISQSFATMLTFHLRIKG